MIITAYLFGIPSKNYGIKFIFISMKKLMSSDIFYAYQGKNERFTFWNVGSCKHESGWHNPNDLMITIFVAK